MKLPEIKINTRESFDAVNTCFTSIDSDLANKTLQKLNTDERLIVLKASNHLV